MTREEAIASLKALCHTCKHFPTCVNDKPECFRAIEMAIKSLEAWEKVKEEVIAKKNFNADVKDAFEVGSHSRIECNTAVAVLGEVLNLIDKHLSEVSE